MISLETQQRVGYTLYRQWAATATCAGSSFSSPSLNLVLRVSEGPHDGCIPDLRLKNDDLFALKCLYFSDSPHY
ncbi:hypothetical protein L484_023718 [Morus notabilis]|uniref:Uncharacterized protein n=1 Tax=Morus notabilis TaxID=981085 RepID=W9QR17_9ROSA|nr:hypothetical protein L484_023718 [Morus notabilis]